MAKLDKNLLEDERLDESSEAARARSGAEPDEEGAHREANAAQLMRFITEVQNGQIPPHSTLENLMNVFIDVLEGHQFDMAFPLPDRDRRTFTDLNRERDAHIPFLVERAIQNSKFRAEAAEGSTRRRKAKVKALSQAEAFSEVGEMIHLSEEQVKTIFQSSPKSKSKKSQD